MKRPREREPRLTEPTLLILCALISQPNEPMYGYELLRHTALQSGTLYPALARLRDAGWLIGTREDIDAAEAGRPARTYYRLTAPGVEGASAALQRLKVPAPAGVPRLRVV